MLAKNPSPPPQSWDTEEFKNNGGAFHKPKNSNISVTQYEDRQDPWPKHDVFHEKGFVLQFDLDNPSSESFVLEVRYRNEDVARAGGNELQLGIYNGTDWLTKEAFEKGSYADKDGKWAGYWKVWIRDMEKDPMVGWGP